jgi:hypothetical protein
MLRASTIIFARVLGSVHVPSGALFEARPIALFWVHRRQIGHGDKMVFTGISERHSTIYDSAKIRGIRHVNVD